MFGDFCTPSSPKHNRVASLGVCTFATLCAISTGLETIGFFSHSRIRLHVFQNAESDSVLLSLKVLQIRI